MKRFFLLGVAFALAFSPTTASATILFPTGGGTGSSTLSGILIGNGVAPVNSLIIGTGLTLTGTTLTSTGGGSSTFGTTSIFATTPLQWNTTTATLSILQAGTSQNGYLSSTDWNTFNNKQPAGTYVTSVTGTANQITSSGSTAITLSLPNHVIFPIDYVASAGSTTNATSTNFAIVGAAANCNGANALTTNSSGVVGCTAQPQGTLTSIAVATANGFAGSSSGGATPSLTLTTTITGLLKGNGTAISAAANGTDFTLLTANTCGAGQFFNSATAAGVLGCGTPAGTTYTGTFPIVVTGSVISSLFSTTSNSGMAQGFQYVGSGGIFQTAASSSLFGFTPQPAGNYLTALTGDGTASGPGSVAFTLATVNNNIGTFNNLTVNAKGLVTAASNIAYDTFGYLFPGNATTTNITFSGGLTGNLTGNASTATTLATGRTISITGDLTYTSPTFDGSSNVTAAGTLATVNTNVGSFTNANITVNAKGLITAASNGTAGGVTSVTATYPILSTGGTTPVISTAFGTTTNTGINAGGLYIGTGGLLQSVATSTITTGSGLSYTGTMGGEFGGVSGTLSVSGLTTSNFASANISQFTNNSGYITGNQTVTLTGAVTGSGATSIATTYATQAANTVLANGTGSTASPTAVATSTLFGNPTPGMILAFLNGQNTFVATTTFSSGLAYLNGNVTNTGVTSNVAGTGISVSGATGAVTVTNTGVISNSCSSGISCSGTNPSTFTNTGVTSIVAGTNVTISGATGAVTINATGGGATFAYPFTPSTDGGINTSATSTPIEGTNPGLGLDVAATSWYGIGGRLLAYASSTNNSTIFGIGTGGQAATTSSSILPITAFGFDVLQSTTGVNNSGFGALVLQKDTTGHDNGGFGFGALDQNTIGNFNFGMGTQSLSALLSGNDNTAIGYLSLPQEMGSDNTGVGFRALSNDTGNFNTAVGSGAGWAGSGIHTANTFIGFDANENSAGTTFSSSTILGYESGFNNAASLNTLIGYESGFNITSGFSNIEIGAAATNTNENLTSGSLNIKLGTNISFPSATKSGQLDIQNIIFGSNNTAQSTFFGTGQIGIGTSSPFARFSVQAQFGDTNSILFAIGSSTSVSATTTLFEINNVGHIITSGTAPTCTTGCTFGQGNDNDFRITTGTTISSEVVTFAASWGNLAPICQATEGNDTASPIVIAASSTPTTVTLTNSALSAKDIDVSCRGIQ